MFKLIIPATAMIGVTYAFARFSFGLFLPEISASLQLTESRAGLIGTIGYISYTLALICAHTVISKFGQHRAVQFSGASATLGLLGISFSPNFLFLALSTFIAGLSSGWSSPAFSQVTKTSLPVHLEDRGNSWMNSGTSFGVIISGPIALFFTEQWRLAFGFFAFLSFVVLVWNTFAIPKQPSIPVTKEAVETGLATTLKKGGFLLLASLLVGFSSAIFWTFARSYLTVIHEWSPREGFIYWIIMGITGIGGSAVGSLIERKGLRFSYRSSLCLLMLSILSLTIPILPTIYFSAIGFGVMYIAMTGILLVWGTRRFPDSPYTGVSLAFLLLGIGQTVGSTTAGYAIEYFSYPFSFTLFSVIGLTGLLVPVKKG